jgi:hypothetical protein
MKKFTIVLLYFGAACVSLSREDGQKPPKPAPVPVPKEDISGIFTNTSGRSLFLHFN